MFHQMSMLAYKLFPAIFKVDREVRCLSLPNINVGFTKIIFLINLPDHKTMYNVNSINLNYCKTINSWQRFILQNWQINKFLQN